MPVRDVALWWKFEEYLSEEVKFPVEIEVLNIAGRWISDPDCGVSIDVPSVTPPGK